MITVDSEKLRQLKRKKMSNDNWKHRSEHMKCATCMWYAPKELAPEGSESTPAALGRCRRHAPTMSGFPAVFESDWCGDHKLDEKQV